MIVYPEEDITTPEQPVKFRCAPPCEEVWSSYYNLIEHAESGHPTMYRFDIGEYVDE